MPTFSRKSLAPVTAGELFAWHERSGAFERLAPPWQRIEVEERQGSIRDGDRTTLRVHQGPIAMRWIAEHRGYRPGEQFEDVQIQGPFRSWHHTHRFEPVDEGSSRLIDEIEYSLPLGRLGSLIAGRKIESDLRRMFDYRHRVTVADLALHARFRGEPRLTVAMTGAGGLVGRALSAVLTTGGHRVIRLVRRSPRGEDEEQWSPEAGVLESERLSGADACVHLAGENIADGRWTPRRRRAIRDSRVGGTRALVESLGRCSRPPRVFLAASAVGFYGDTGTSTVAEGAPAGEGFLAEVCRAWEEASQAASAFADRVVVARFGVILSPRGGALARMLPPFLAGAGGPVGGGEQRVSWISIDDAVGALVHLLMTRSADGPFNVTAPTPATQREIARALGRVLRRPALFPLPSFAVRLLFGEMGEELLLASTAAVPTRLLDSGHDFRHATVGEALAHLLGRVSRTE